MNRAVSSWNGRKRLRAVFRGPVARMQLDGLNGNLDGSALQPSQQPGVRAVLLPGDLQRRLRQQKTQHSQQIRLTLTGTPIAQNGGEGEVEASIGESQR